jgi:uncharacterized membrane protein SirB2
MPESLSKPVQDIHVLTVLLFFGSILIKTILLLSNSSAFEKVRKRFMIPEMLLGILLLTTGVMQLVRIGFDGLGGWFHLKLTLVVVAIPLAIIGFRKRSKWLALLGCLLFLYVLLMALSKNVNLSDLDFSRLWN